MRELVVVLVMLGLILALSLGLVPQALSGPVWIAVVFLPLLAALSDATAARRDDGE